MERRYLEGIDCRDADDGPIISGLASVFYDGTPETEFQLAPGIRERIMPGAFDEALKSDDVRALVNHDPSLILGRSKARSLNLSVSKQGLRYEINPGDTSVARNAREWIRRGELDGSSFGFKIRGVGGEKWVSEKDADIREVRAVELYDVGPVTFPAYSGTEVQSRDLFWGMDPERLVQIRELRKLLEEGNPYR